MASILTKAARGILGEPRYLGMREAYLQYKTKRALWNDPRWKESVKGLWKLQDKHKGQRCFIIGNGPSLNQTNLSLLKNEVTFGTNRFYLMKDKIGFLPTYYVCINKLVTEQCAEDIQKLPVPKFLSWHAREYIKNFDNTMFLHDHYDGFVGFPMDITERIWEGATVTYVSMQVAYYLGFSQAILVGVDHNFTTKGPAHQVVESKGDDPNHFDPTYFGKGFRWQLPDLETSEVAYNVAKVAYADMKRDILDATVGGKLTVFPKVQLESLFR